MKTFAQYLTESEKTFDYRIKILGDVPTDFIRDLKDQLKKFEPVKISEPKKTPVLSKPLDFPNFSNESVTMMDATFRYPATPPQLEQMVRLLGVDPNRVCMVQRDYDDGIDRELAGIETQKDLLTTDYPADNAEQKKLKKEHADGNQQVVKNSADAAKWTVAGGKTPPAKTTNDLPMGVKSPMSAVKRPPKPATGAHPKG